jgi:hypothetical protein
MNSFIHTTHTHAVRHVVRSYSLLLHTYILNLEIDLPIQQKIRSLLFKGLRNTKKYDDFALFFSFFK